MKKGGFTIIELLVGIIIFTLGTVSAYLLVYTALSSSTKSRDEIIAGNIAREKLELVRNIRDTNWLRILKWDKLDNGGLAGSEFQPGFYKIENDFSQDIPNNNSISIKKLSGAFDETNSYIMNPTDLQDNTRLCVDTKGRYTYNCTGTNKETPFFSYIKIEEVKTKSNAGTEILVSDAFRVRSINVIRGKGFPRYEVDTIITNWKK